MDQPWKDLKIAVCGQPVVRLWAQWWVPLDDAAVAVGMSRKELATKMAARRQRKLVAQGLVREKQPGLFAEATE
jgi:hypothetical protein